MNTRIIKTPYREESDPVPWQTSKKIFNTRIGIMVVIEDFMPTTSFVLPYRIKTSHHLELVYAVSADVRIKVDVANASSRVIDISSGHRVVSQQGFGSGILELSCRKPFKVMHLCIPWDKFKTVFTNDTSLVDRFIRTTVPSKVICGWIEKMPAIVESIVLQIIHCRLSPPALRLYVEGKVLELLSWELEQWCGGQQNVVGLSSADIRQLQQARKIVLERYQNPPSLASLARSVGLNVNKLKIGFCKMYNDTVYGVLRTHRMEMARMFLESGEVNVSETAVTVGYSNISHFSSAFHKTYGILPGQYLKEARLKIPLSSLEQE